MTAALGEMRGTYSRVILDAPAMQPFSDAALLAVQADSHSDGGPVPEGDARTAGRVPAEPGTGQRRRGGSRANALPLRLSEGRKQPRTKLRKPRKGATVTLPEAPAEPAPAQAFCRPAVSVDGVVVVVRAGP